MCNRVISATLNLKLLTKFMKYFCAYYCITEYGIEFVFCTGPSMAPTILSEDIVLAEHVSVLLHRINRNDIVICRSPRNPVQLVCKRVTAIEGDLIYGSVGEYSSVPKGHVWLEGDNRSDSTDSWQYGPVPYGLVRSRVIYRLWPNPNYLYGSELSRRSLLDTVKQWLVERKTG